MIERRIDLIDDDVAVIFQHDRTIPVIVRLTIEQDRASEDFFHVVTHHHLIDDRGNAVFLPRKTIRALESLRQDAEAWHRQMRQDN